MGTFTNNHLIVDYDTWKFLYFTEQLLCFMNMIDIIRWNVEYQMRYSKIRI